MRRLQRAITAFALAALAAPAVAAEITHVASSGEPKNPFDLDLSVRYEREQERATIARETSALPVTPGAVPDELRFTRTRHAIVPRIAIGLWHDLEIHAELPYVLADDRTWRFGNVYGKPSGGVPGSSSSIENNQFDADGLTSAAGAGHGCPAATCPLFPVAPETTVYHGGMLGDLKAGIAWGIFNDRKDSTKPTWVVGTDVTFPTAKLYDPAADRGSDWGSPYMVSTKPGPFGEKVWKADFYTALSKRMGVIDPYVKAHFTKEFKSSSTYSNCDHAAEMTSAATKNSVGAQMNQYAVANCATWGTEAGAKLPWIAGLTLGTEVVPYEDPIEGQSVSFDFRLFADYTSAQRFYNELTDATGKIHQTGSYLDMGGLFGLYLRASSYVQLQATASLSTRSAHYLTGESLGKYGTTPPPGADPSAINPNYDWRWDPPGRRFRISEVSVFEISASGIIRF